MRKQNHIQRNTCRKDRIHEELHQEHLQEFQAVVDEEPPSQCLANKKLLSCDIRVAEHYERDYGGTRSRREGNQKQDCHCDRIDVPEFFSRYHSWLKGAG